MIKHFTFRLALLPILFALVCLVAYRYFFHTAKAAVEHVEPASELSQSVAPLDIQVTYNPLLGMVESNHPTKELDDYNAKLARTFQSPLLINLKSGSTYSDFFLSPMTIREIIVPRSTDPNGVLGVSKAKLLENLTPHLTAKQQEYFDAEVVYQNVKTSLNARFAGAPTPVVKGIDDGPKSSGELADRYLEIDLSQQKMYFFVGGTLQGSYHISTGIDYPTPVGEFRILNKAPLAFSDIYQVWMPYWMAFTYASDVGAYLGLHEIAYAVGDKGQRIYQNGNYIGDKGTGGCIAMDPKDSKLIYDLSEVGMLVRVVH